MPQARTVILILTALLAINALLPRSVAFWAGNLVEPLVQTLLIPGRPLMNLVASPRESVTPPAPDLDEDRLRYDYDLAQVELDRLRQQNARLKQRLAEIMPSRDLLAERGLHELRQVSARINPGGGRGVRSIAAGSRDGIAPGQTVIFDIHVVGQVVAPVGPTTANVALITTLRPSLSVRFVAPASESPPGSLLPARSTAARVALAPDGRTFTADDIDPGADVRVGDIVRMADELSFAEAQGFQLGTVTAVQPLPKNPQLLHRVTVTPAIDLQRLGRVTVLVPTPAPGSSSSPATPGASK